MKVVVLYNEASQDATVDERDILAQRDAVLAALKQLGHDATPLPCTLDLGTAKARLEELRADSVFNLVESLGGTDRMMPAATLLLEALGLPYTGNPTRSILATSNKLGAKELLRRAGLPTPEWWGGGRLRATGCRRQEDQNSEIHLPLEDGRPATSKTVSNENRVIVKAIWEHASFNMDDDAVVSLEAGQSLDEILQCREELTGRPHFAEAYIEGREFNLTMLAGPDGPQVLPPAEIDFASYPADKPRIVGYRAKWDEASFEYENTPRRFEFSADDRHLLARLAELAKRCWHLFELRGYARVDFRVDRAGNPWILEVNANPCLAPDAGFAAAVDRAGISYAHAIGRILDDVEGLTRSPMPSPHFAVSTGVQK